MSTFFIRRNFAVETIIFMRSRILLLLCALPALSALAGTKEKTPTIPADSSHSVDLEEIYVIASPKQTNRLRNSAVSVSNINLKEDGLKNLSEISGYVPNFFMPAYGSAQSSAIYIRGVGSRINTPAVALYVDNIPVSEKSAYNFNLLGVNRIDVLRGPQGTLYGRNAMGGIIHIYTDNPLIKQGTTFSLGASSRDEGMHFSALSNLKLSNKLGLSLGGFYETDKGIYRNDSLNKKVGGTDQMGGRIRLVYHPAEKWNFDLTSSYEYTDQSTYPYFYAGTITGKETLPNILNQITANRESKYYRNLFNTGFRTEYEAPLFTISSITSYQYLKDNIRMDQDFTYLDCYALQQLQNSNTLTEEIALKSLPQHRWEWSGGLFGLWQNLRTTAPVTFYSDGMAMLNGMMANVLPPITATNPYTGQPLTITQQLAFTDANLPINSYFHTPVLNGAAFFEGTLHDFLISRLSLTLGARYDYEHQEMRYTGSTDKVNYLYTMQMIQPAALSVESFLKGKIQNDYTRLLPKVAVKYDLQDDLGNIYASLSEGQRAGGYNIQMFSDVMNTVMQGNMMTTTKNYCDNLLQTQADNAHTEAMKQMFLGIKTTMDNSIPPMQTPDIHSIVTYKPEYCWNYEVGTHLNFLERTLTADISTFFTDTHNQQIARFTNSGMGRMMVNAGRSYSCGIEAVMRGNFLNDRLFVTLNYGYTHATFHRYDAGNGADYSGNTVPFIPEHTMGLVANYKLPLQNQYLHSITFGANANGFGRMYWTESNNAYQNFYATVGSHVLFDFGTCELNMWGKNLSQTKYKTFYFESMNRGFYQKGNPMQIGFDFTFKI